MLRKVKNTKEDSYVVLKRSDFHNLSSTEQDILDILLNKVRGLKPANKYYVVNTDEPYAKRVLDTILEGERDKRPFSTILVQRLPKYLGCNFTHVDVLDNDIPTIYIETTIEDYPLAEPESMCYSYMKLAQTIRIEAALKTGTTIDSDKKYQWVVASLVRDTDRAIYKDTYTLYLAIQEVV